MHTGENPFKCDVCYYSTTGTGPLKKQKPIHTGEKPFKCDVCNYSTTSIGDLKSTNAYTLQLFLYKIPNTAEAHPKEA